MTPNDFGIIRQADHNLLACMFPNFPDISEYDFEIINPEYIDGGLIVSNGGYTASPAFSYAVVNISKYDYVLAYAAATGATVISSGTTGSQSGTGEAFSRYGGAKSTLGLVTSLWTLIPVDKDYLVLNTVNKLYAPVIGFKRHRSDHVNPLGIIQPLNPGALQPDDPDPDPEEQEER